MLHTPMLLEVRGLYPGSRSASKDLVLWSGRREPVGELVSMLVKLSGWDNFVDEPELFRFFRRYCFTCHDQFKGLSGTDHSCQEVTAAGIGYQAHPDEGLFESRFLRGHTDVTSEG